MFFCIRAFSKLSIGQTEELHLPVSTIIRVEPATNEDMFLAQNAKSRFSIRDKCGETVVVLSPDCHMRMEQELIRVRSWESSNPSLIPP